MKKFLLYLVSTTGIILLGIYLAFLFYLPHAIDLKTFLPELQKIVKEQANIDINIEDPQISTNPLLQAGIKTGKITAKLPDGSTIFDTDGIKFRISLPNLLFLTVKASCVEINSPKINLEIINNEQYKIIRLVEDILNKKKNEPITANETKSLPIELSMIKIKIPHAKITDYDVTVNDLKTGHKLTLKGDELIAGYNNRKTAYIKTEAKILSDNNVNVTAKLNLDSYIPPAKEKDLDDDPAEKIELPFINPVLVYRNYDLKSDIDAKLKLRKNEEGKNNLKGYAIIDNTTMTLSGLQLPKSFIKAKFKDNYAEINTNLAIKQDQKIQLDGNINYGKNPNIYVDIFTDKIYFNDMVILAKAFLDTIHVKNNLAHIKAKGYWAARAKIQSDFKNLKSDGCIIARDGSISNGNTNLVFDKIRANLIFKDDTIKITDTQTLINGGILKAEGTINTDSYSNISINSDKLPIPGLFNAFAPADLKRSISLTSGILTLNAQLEGFLKTPVAFANTIINNLSLRNESININNEKLIAGVVTDLKTIDGNVSNKNFTLKIPKTNSIIQNPQLSIKLNEQDIEIQPASILVNNNSIIGIFGSLNNYAKSPKLKFEADGTLNANDLKKFAGETAAPFIEAKGDLPIKADISGTDKKQSVILQIKSDGKNYITPVEVQSIIQKPTILQAKIDRTKEKLHIKKTGFYTTSGLFTNNFEDNMLNAQKIAEVNGTIIHLNTEQPFINMIKLDIPETLNAKFTTFKNSRFKFGGNLLVFGKLTSPIMRGNFKIFDLNIPEILTSMNQANIDLSGKNIVLDIQRLLLNGSDINLSARTDINPRPIFTVFRTDINSRFIDIDKTLKVLDLLNKYTVSSTNQKSDIPLILRTGSININEIKSGEIKLENTTGRISLQNNIFRLNNLDTTVFKGLVNGDISVDLISLLINAKLQGKALNVETALLSLANMKDTLTGNMNFDTNINFNGTTPEEIMQNLKGDFKFLISDGQLGPFGKLENMIMAENIRESKFFQTALGGVINNLATIDTSHFNTMDGLIAFENGIAHIAPITTVGNVMSLHIAGDFNLLENKMDMKVRAKLGSVIANLLGPLAQLNPINLIEATPGLNVVMAKAFFLFCEQLTPEETAALPHLESPLDDKLATKFQIVLRGDVSKPLTLIKSFKWLALASDIEKAQNMVSTLPDPVDDQNATLEEILKAQEEQAIEDAKLKNKIKRFFTKK